MPTSSSTSMVLVNILLRSIAGPLLHPVVYVDVARAVAGSVGQYAFACHLLVIRRDRARLDVRSTGGALERRLQTATDQTDRGCRIAADAKGLLSAHAVLAASATQTPMMTVAPRIRVIASSPLVQVCEETPHAELVLSCDDYRRHVRYRRQRFSQEFVMARSAATTRPARTTSSLVQSERSEERRVGKECRSGW